MPAPDDTEPPTGDATRLDTDATRMDAEATRLDTDATRMDADATRLDAEPVAARVEPPAAQADAFASWYRQEVPGAGQADDPDWQPTQTMRVAQTPPDGYPFSPYPQSPPFPPDLPSAPPNRGSGNKGLFIAVAVIVILVLGGSGTRSPPTSPSTRAPGRRPLPW